MKVVDRDNWSRDGHIHERVKISVSSHDRYLEKETGTWKNKIFFRLKTSGTYMCSDDVSVGLYQDEVKALIAGLQQLL